MTQLSNAIKKGVEPRDRLIVALDVSSADEARSIIDELRGEVGGFKIGLQLFTAAGPEFAREVIVSGERVFLDLKFHDIPNTVAKAAVEAARLGVWMLNVHASGGSEMMRHTASEVRAVCESEGLSCPLLIAVTVLTSSNKETLGETGAAGDVVSQVTRLAALTADSGFDGVVASSHEVTAIRSTVKRDGFLIVTPGIRPISATQDDQRRVTTFAQAIANGSDHVVVGRPITQAGDRLMAVKQLLAEI